MDAGQSCRLLGFNMNITTKIFQGFEEAVLFIKCISGSVKT